MTDLLSATALGFGFGQAAVFPDLSIARIPRGSKPDAVESDFKPRHCRRQLLDECSIRNTALRNQACISAAAGVVTPGFGEHPVACDEFQWPMPESHTNPVHAARMVHLIRRNDD
ncbi:MAG: hypothetical protein OXF56_14905 [Rhodobacteraceae bacterium]|nr:hypothetical protein [Paracoccaceae bacterium]